MEEIDSSAWENQMNIGNYFGTKMVPGLLAHGYNSQFSDSVEVLLDMTPAGVSIIMGEPTDPSANGMYFNHINDFKGSGMGITGSQFTALFTTTLVPSVSGNYKFKMNSADDNAWTWFDFDQDGIFEMSGDLGSEKVGQANQEFGPQEFTSPDIYLTAGQEYNLGLISANYGGGGTFRPWIQVPGGSMEVMNPSSVSQQGLFNVPVLSNDQPQSTQISLDANLSALTPDTTYFYRVRATNSLGIDWSDASSSFFTFSPPTDLNSTAPLIISENQPIGAVIGEFNSTDLNANATLTYHLFDNNGSTDNSFFTLDSNGTLKTATTFDYEWNSAYTIKVQVRDEHNASMTKSFSVLITDLYEAPALTGTPQSGTWSIKKQWPVAHSYGVFTRIDPISNKELIYVGNGQGDGTSQVYIYDLNGTLLDSVLGMNYPNDVVLDTNGEMFVAEWALVRAHDENGTLKWRKGKNPTYHETGSGNGHFHNAAGIDVWNGEIFVADQNNHRVQVLDKQGNYLRKFGTQGTIPEKFNDVTDLAFLSDGNLIIADSNYLHYYLKDGTFLKRTNVDGAGTFVSVGPNGEIFSNQRVRDGDGITLSHIPEINSNARSAFTSQGDIVTSYNGIIKLWSTRNYPPYDLNTTSPLIIAENQPIGTVIGEFNATDPDANATLTYHLFDNNGSTDNSFFTLESNGTLKSATTFDFENNKSTYTIQVLAKDDKNATTSDYFTVNLSRCDSKWWKHSQ